jgi:hypothetical protein
MLFRKSSNFKLYYDEKKMKKKHSNGLHPGIYTGCFKYFESNK